ncbi:MAG TPA: ElyC/SanA/YdcF family protein, partial [Blastocatellia bacterium]|nr:ElyC/SanA/YdcF family protein [Blastocatellia bacterium]
EPHRQIDLRSPAMIKRRILIATAALLLITLVAVAFIHFRVHRYDRFIMTPAQVDTSTWEKPRVAIVFGASVHPNGELSQMLEDRVETAIALYREGKVDRILVSGDNRQPEYNEPKAMYDYLVTHAVAPKDVVLDYAGRSTYETCLRAKEIFGLHRALLITQEFHLPRAVYLAHSLGLDGTGVIADRRDYGTGTSYQKVRELFAEVKAYFNVHLFPPETLLGEKLPIR